MLCPPTIEVFMLEKFDWGTYFPASIWSTYIHAERFPVAQPTFALEDVSYPDEEVLDQLALSDDQINYLKSLGNLPSKDTYERPNKAATNFRLGIGLKKDIGTFILLRGDAGAGKTLTAEAFAAHVRKPLLTMGSGDLAGSAKDAETALAKYFRLAKTWDCILLFKKVDFILPRETGRRASQESSINEHVS